MSHTYDLNEVMDLVEEAQQKLGRFQGSAAYAPGVRQVLEMLALRAFQKNRPPHKEQVAESPYESEDEARTPVYSPRGVVRENKVVQLPKPPRRK